MDCQGNLAIAKWYAAMYQHPIQELLLHERNWSLGPTIPPPHKKSQGWEASALTSISLVYS